MSRGSIHVRGVFESREMCWKCRRPMRVCYCAAVKPIETRTRVVILQHPRESDVPINTARIAELSLRRSTLHVGLDFSAAPAFLAAISDSEAPPILLYPGEGAKDLAREPPIGPVTLVVIDGTWWQASKLFKLNPLLQQLPCYGLAPTEESRYRIRKEPEAHCLSTIEALEAALSVLEGKPAGLPELLEPFDAMVDMQLGFVARENRPRHVRSAVPRLRPLVAPALSERPESLVVGYGEANAWPYGGGGLHPPEVVHWAAVRPATGERFEAYIFDRRPGASLAQSYVNLFPVKSNQKRALAYSEIARLEFTGKDRAAGHHWESWVKQYKERKAAGEKQVGLHPEALD